MIELTRKRKRSRNKLSKTLKLKLKIIRKQSTAYPNRKVNIKWIFEKLEQLISDLKEKENDHQQEIAQLNETISVVTPTRK